MEKNENLDDSLEEYKWPDGYIRIQGKELTKDGAKKVLKLGNLYPKIEIYDLYNYTNTFEDFKKGEEVVDEILSGINADWTDIQKLAYVDNQIGTYINYSPEINSDAKYDTKEKQKLWKTLANREGVCAGIVQAEQYILYRVGVKSKEIFSKNHAFLLVKDIDIPQKDGTIIKGDTINDPTWNMEQQKFLSMPKQFGKSYDEIRKLDIEKNGIDNKTHKAVNIVDISIETATKEEINQAINLDENSLRKVYSSIGIANENGKFPLESWKKYIKFILKNAKTYSEKMEVIFRSLKGINTNFIKAQSETSSFLKKIMSDKELFPNLKYASNRVYDKNDVNKKPLLYVYLGNDEEEEFYVANKDKTKMVKKSKKEFLDNYCRYKNDKQKDGKVLWEEDKEIE